MIYVRVCERFHELNGALYKLYVNLSVNIPTNAQGRNQRGAKGAAP